MSDDLPPKYEDLIIDGRNVAYISSQSNIAPSTTTASRDVAIPNVPAQIAVTNIAQNVQPAVTRWESETAKQITSKNLQKYCDKASTNHT